MATDEGREAIDERIKGWERDLEQVRLALASAPEALHQARSADFAALYRRKEVIKSRWEQIRGVYGPESADVQAFEEALTAMEAAWRDAKLLLSEAAAASASSGGS